MTVAYPNPNLQADQVEVNYSLSPRASGGLALQEPAVAIPPQCRLGQAAQAAFAWECLLSRYQWDWFITLTVDPKRYSRMGRESWVKAWKWWLFAWIASCAVRAGLARLEPRRGHESAEISGEWNRDMEHFQIKGWWVNRWRKGGGVPVWVLGLEPHQDGRLHAHVLLKFPEPLAWLRKDVGQELWWRNRGIMHFEEPGCQAAVTRYVSKYVLKGGSDSLEFSPNFDAASMMQ